MSPTHISSQLLEALLSPDAGIRSQAESVYHSLSVVDRVQDLLRHVSVNDGPSSSSSQSQLLASVLLRREILKLKEVNFLQEVVPPLLAAFSQDKPCRLQIGHCLAEVCASLSLVGDVNQVMPIILQSIETNLHQQDIVSLKLLASLADRAPMAYSQLAIPSLAALIPTTFSSSKVLEAWTEIIVNSAVATTVQSVSLIRTAPKLDDLIIQESSVAANMGSSLIPILSHLPSTKDDEAVQNCLQHLSHAAVTCPSLLGGSAPVLEALVSSCLQIAQSTTGIDNNDNRMAAMEVLASLLSVGDVKRRKITPTMASTIASAVFPICIQLLVDSTDDDFNSWAAQPATLVGDGMEDDDDDVGDCLFAESLVESFLRHLPNGLSVALPLVQILLESQDSWKRVHAGLVVLKCALAATPIGLVPHVPTVVQAGLTLASPSTPASNVRVQWQALCVLGALCETSAAKIRQSNAQSVLERLALGLASPSTKVSSLASVCLVSYCRGAEDDFDVESQLLPYLSDLLTALVRGPLSLEGTDTGSVSTRVRAMGATACLAEATEENFVPYYSTIMPGLLASAQLPAVELVEAAVEAASIVGCSVGKEMFGQDARQLLSWIVPVLNNDNAPGLEQLLLACARIASVLEDEFAPYANTVMPLLLARAQEAPDVSVMEGNEAEIDSSNDNDENNTESMTVAVPGRGFTKVSINSTKIQEKAQATRAVYEHAKAMGAAFGPYCQDSLETFLQLVSFPYSADVRGAAAQTLSAVFDAACAHGQEVLGGRFDLAQKYLPLLSNAISKQIVIEDVNDMEAMYALADALSEVYYIAYRYRQKNNSGSNDNILTEFTMTDAETTVVSCMKAMVACLDRRNKVTQILSSQQLTGEDEREEYLSMLKSEENLLTPLVDSVGYTLKFLGRDFVPMFEKYIVPVLGPRLLSKDDVRAMISAVCLFDDCVEHCGSDAAAKYSPHLVQAIVLALKETTEPDLLRPAVYGLSQIVRKVPHAAARSLLLDNLPTIVQTLLSLTSKVSSKEEAGDQAYLLELVASCLASLTLFGPFSDDFVASRDVIVNAFLTQLPIQQDDDEAKICHAGLCTLIDSGMINVQKEAHRLIGIIELILADIEDGEEVATPETCQRLSFVASTVVSAVHG